MATIDADLSAVPTPSEGDRSHLETKADRETRDERVHSHLGLAHQLARRFSNRGESHDDLVQVASLALVRAAERFDPDRGVMFSTFAAASIIGELKRHFRDRGWAVRAPRRLQEMVLEIGSTTDRLGQELGRAPTVSELAKEIRASEADVLEALEAGQSYRTSSLDARDREGQSMAESLGSEDSGFVGVENHSALTKAMATLSPRDREIVQLRFVEGMTQSEIAARLGVSQMQISRLLAASLRRLRSNIEARERTSTLSSL
jgi:RNA polymerase sigma-B factor